LIQFGGSSLSLFSACSQVFTTRMVNPSCHSFLVVVIFIIGESLVDNPEPPAFYFFCGVCFLCITLSHLSTQMRYADSERCICGRQVGPWSVIFLRCWWLLQCHLSRDGWLGLFVPLFFSSLMMFSLVREGVGLQGSYLVYYSFYLRIHRG